MTKGISEITNPTPRAKEKLEELGVTVKLEEQRRSWPIGIRPGMETGAKITNLTIDGLKFPVSSEEKANMSFDVFLKTLDSSPPVPAGELERFRGRPTPADEETYSATYEHPDGNIFRIPPPDGKGWISKDVTETRVMGPISHEPGMAAQRELNTVFRGTVWKSRSVIKWTRTHKPQERYSGILHDKLVLPPTAPCAHAWGSMYPETNWPEIHEKPRPEPMHDLWESFAERHVQNKPGIVG